MDTSLDSAIISVIVPVLGEAGQMGALIDPGVELVVVDGDPERSTLVALERALGRGLPEKPGGPGSVCGLSAGPGRGAQMNAGAALATGEVLLFLHADTSLPPGWAEAVHRVLASGFTSCGAFSLCFEGGGVMGRMAGAWATLRSRLDRRPYGDQAQFFGADFFRELGGYADLPLMEDVEIMGRAERAGQPPVILPLRASTSPRRYQTRGWLRQGLGNLTRRVAYELGADPARLANRYPAPDTQE